jgi:hypothetical protein
MAVVLARLRFSFVSAIDSRGNVESVTLPLRNSVSPCAKLRYQIHLRLVQVPGISSCTFVPSW